MSILEARVYPLTGMLLAAFGILTFAAAPPPSPCRNGVYLLSEWMSREKGGIELSRLRDTLIPARVTDLYVAIEDRHLTTAGPRIERLRTALRPVGQPAPRVHAWFGRRVCAEGEPILGCISLTRSGNASTLVRLGQLAWDAGFDAVHLNLEPVPDGDGVFLTLLDSLREIRPRGRQLSVAGYLLATPKAPAGVLQWSDRYYREVLKRVDHAMVMNYDTGIADPKAYMKATETQVRELYRLAREAKVELRLGVPAFDRGRGKLFRAHAENPKTASEGVRAAIRGIIGRSGRAECPEAFGLALFREGEISGEEWAHFTETWGSGASQSRR